MVKKTWLGGECKRNYVCALLHQDTEATQKNRKVVNKIIACTEREVGLKVEKEEASAGKEL